ncbi:alpha-1,3-mannosyl-glycoprotein 4-beta-N-acetylglucosaminyltransferase C-like [Ruditapes philippinarum]|uniref:alpha-1,3-mannosyl-glycoprotein 4-beta-N-acetylglucosaminyltransferase C-like n=1 Tax=Ruditapes philippinarum TaxID=129788 RepID=UPI00295A67E4|nr:alpha-1,3-mannosyl-glycoprotein 4-beta-N-acetylglucosaminyltransferase C-like [Ruditapes philippinarum]
MISKQNIKVSLVILLFVYICIQLFIVQVKNYKSKPSQMISYDQVSESITTFPNSMTALSSWTTTRNVSLQQSKCNGSVNLIRGHLRQYQGFLTIGLCTVPRSKATYLKDTLTSLIHHMTNEQKEKIVIIVFLGFHNESDVDATVHMIEYNFNDSLSTGGLQIIQPAESVYPDFSKMTKQTFKDSMKRVHWRTKQNIDFAYLFGYSEKLSKYYMHVEDDVDATPKYLNIITDSLIKEEKAKHHWFVLDFGEGFIGKLFRSSDLCMMKDYLLLFQDQKPCDLLLEDLKQIQLHNFKKVSKVKKVFKHRGKYSSLEGKIVPDEKAKVTSKKSLSITTEPLYVSNLTSNPPAIIETTFKTFSNFTPEYAYEINSTLFFWAKVPKVGEYYRVKLQSRVLCSRIAIRTGAPKTGTDRLENAEIVISYEPTNDGTCKGKKSVGTLSHGKFEQTFVQPQALKCLEIIMTKKQNDWLIISQIEIET